MTASLITAITRDLHEHQALCREVLALIERESQALRGPDSSTTFELLQAKRAALQRLQELLGKIQQHRLRWQSLSPAERADAGEVTALLRQNQDIIMRIIVLDRENEQALLRKGLVPPRHLPPANRQRPHFVADLYRRQAAGAEPMDQG